MGPAGTFFTIGVEKSLPLTGIDPSNSEEDELCAIFGELSDFSVDYTHYTSEEDCRVPLDAFPVEHTRVQTDTTSGHSRIYVSGLCLDTSDSRMAVGNLNGGSVLDGNKCALSEYLAMATLGSAWGARLVRTECEIDYCMPNGKKTDMIVAIPVGDNEAILAAVSVTRAMRHNGEFDAERARTLLTKKYFGVEESNLNVYTTHPHNRWCRQYMFVWCEDEAVCREIEQCEVVPPENTTLITCTHAPDFADIY
jgi:hypothetical protein